MTQSGHSVAVDILTYSKRASMGRRYNFLGRADKRKSPSDCSSGPYPAQNLLKSLRTLGNFELENSSKLACQFFPEFQNDLTNPPGGLELIFNPHLAIFLWNMGISGRCSLGYAIDVVDSENLNSVPSKDFADTA